MANMELIETKTVGVSGASSITFSSITSNYTDLKLICSTRSSSGDVGIWIRLNGDSNQSYLWKQLWAGGSGNYGSYAQSVGTNYDRSFFAYAEPGTYTSGVFSNVEIYIPNYQSSVSKTISIDGVGETNADTAYRSLTGGLYSTSSSITSISILVENGTANFVEGSTVSLYGISAVPSSPKATGGIVSQDANYWYHMFPFSSTFTPTSALTNVDYLVIAGGGAGGSNAGNIDEGAAGGGAGGLRSTVDVTGGGGTLESKISMNSGTVYTITVGAGGTPNSGNTKGSSGGNSSIAGTGLTTITSLGGSGGASYTDGAITGGSGGGAAGYGTTNYGAGTANQGYAGGNTLSSGRGAGGGGAGAVGGNAVTNGDGGTGVAIPNIANATNTGISTYYAGGGGGGGRRYSETAPGMGGTGGGGRGGSGNNIGVEINGINGATNTGSGGGGGSSPNSVTQSYGGNGGSGLVVLKYAK